MFPRIDYEGCLGTTSKLANHQRAGVWIRRGVWLTAEKIVRHEIHRLLKIDDYTDFAECQKSQVLSAGYSMSEEHYRLVRPARTIPVDPHSNQRSLGEDV